MGEHADVILAAVGQRDATSSIAASWRRCAVAHSLHPDRLHIPERENTLLADACERDAALIYIANPYLDHLFEMIGDPEGNTSLGDRHGIIIAIRFGTSHDVHQRRPWRMLGVEATEATFGTNGNGTCIVEQRPVVIDGGQHFMSALTGMMCFAAPIFGPDGRLIACLNATTTEPRGRQIRSLARTTVCTYAQRIEIELFAANFAGSQFVLVPRQGLNQAALLAVDGDHRVVGATRGARRLLSLDDTRLDTGLDLTSLGLEDEPPDLATAERRIVARALARHNGNVSAAARQLGIGRSTLNRKMKEAPPGHMR